MSAHCIAAGVTVCSCGLSIVFFITGFCAVATVGGGVGL
jgi:pyruvate formate-lyase activating enzyme-like uncharacterized protein